MERPDEEPAIGGTPQHQKVGLGLTPAQQRLLSIASDPVGLQAPGRRPDWSAIEEALRLRAEGMTVDEIASRTGRPRNSIRNWLRLDPNAYETQPPRFRAVADISIMDPDDKPRRRSSVNSIPAETATMIVGLRMAGREIREIARETGWSAGAVETLLRRWRNGWRPHDLGDSAEGRWGRLTAAQTRSLESLRALPARSARLERVLRAFERRAAGKTYQEIADEIGVSFNCIRKWLHKDWTEPPPAYDSVRFIANPQSKAGVEQC